MQWILDLLVVFTDWRGDIGFYQHLGDGSSIWGRPNWSTIQHISLLVSDFLGFWGSETSGTANIQLLHEIHMALPMEGGGWAVVGRLYWSDVQLWIDPMLSSGRAGSTAAGHARSFSKSRRSTRGRERSWNSILEEQDPERLDHLEEVARFRRSRWGTTTSRSFSTVSRTHRNILKPLLIATRKLIPFKNEIFQK